MRTLSVITLIALLCYGGFKAVFGKVSFEPAPILPDHGDNGDANGSILGDNEGDGTQAERKKDYYTFLLAGLDEDKTRTDTLIVASYDGTTQKVELLNIPRDTISDCKRKIKKINSAFGGGIEQTKEELQNILGIPIDRYIIVDFSGFAQLVDAIGGIDFDVPVNMKYDDPYQDLYIDIQKGYQHLNGKQALELVRFRKGNDGSGYPDGDLGRINTQQNFLRAIAAKLLSPSSIFKIADIANAVLDNTKTDLTLVEMGQLGVMALGMDSQNITMSTLPGEARYLFEPDFGHNQSYFVPDEQGILDLINEKFNPVTTPVTKLKLIDMSRYN